VILVLVLACVIAMSGGFIVGVALGTLAERERAARRRPPAPHEALATVYEMPTPEAILAELRGPLPGRRA
jgi:hypothetical protein